MKTKPTLTLFILILAGIVPLSLWGYSKKTSKDPSPEEMRSTMKLKQYMGEFGTLVAGMEIMKFKEAKPDWEVIDLTLREMDQTLKNMEQTDVEGNYREFTDVLEANLAEVKTFGKKRDKKIFDSFDKLTETCFKCHAAHRPSDFPVTKPKEPKISSAHPATLFQPEKN